MTPQIARPTSEERLRELASKATPGPWKFVALAGSYTELPENLLVIGTGEPPSRNDLDKRGVAVSKGDNAAFIAACSPDAILALLDRLDQLREVVEAARKNHPSCGAIHRGRFELGMKEECEALRRLDSASEPKPSLFRHSPTCRIAFHEGLCLDSDTPATEPERE